jgi:hypothetical protein
MEHLRGTSANNKSKLLLVRNHPCTIIWIKLKMSPLQELEPVFLFPFKILSSISLGMMNLLRQPRARFSLFYSVTTIGNMDTLHSSISQHILAIRYFTCLHSPVFVC